MLALHASWTPAGRLALWVEDPERFAFCPSDEDHDLPRPHPFAAPTEALTSWLADRDIEAEDDDLSLLLPTSPTGPSPSPFVWLDVDALPAPPDRLRPWSVLTSMVPASQAHRALSLLHDPPPDMVVADDLSALQAIHNLAQAIVDHGSFAPDLTRGPDGWEARWVPRPTAPEHLVTRRALIDHLPPILRASGALRVGATAWEDALVPDRAEVVDNVLRALVDGLARTRVIPRPLNPRVRKPEPIPALLAALTGPEPLVHPTADVASLHPALQAWAPSTPTTDTVRTAFRISAPDEADLPWVMEIVLQGVDDPTLLVPAEEIWKARRTLEIEGRQLVRPQERLLGDLGRAARLVPLLLPLLQDARPRRRTLTADEAWTFLREAAAPLSQAGFGLITPPWWDRPRARLGRRLAARPRAGSSIGLNGLVEVRWEIALGDAAISEVELRELAKRKAPLVWHRGQWVELRREDLDAALAFYEKKVALGNMDVRTALHTALGLQEESGLPVHGITGEGWLGELFGKQSESFAAIPSPHNLHATLRPYQERGLGWLAWHDRIGLGVCLADDMGLGKTIQVLALMLHERRDGPVGPTLLVCPTSLVGNWEREAARFAPSLRVAVQHGAARADKKGLAKLAKQHDLVLTSFGTLVRDLAAYEGVRWRRVVVDEAQNIKNPDTASAKAVRAIEADRRLALTGTPIENRLDELWALFDFLDPGLLGPLSRFREHYAWPIERQNDTDRAEQLRRIIGPFMLRRLKTDKAIVADLPEKIEIEEPCSLTREQAGLYRAVVDDLLGKLEEGTDAERRISVLASMTRLKQICDHPALFLQDRSALLQRSGKLNRLEEIIDEVLDGGEKALLFTQFAEFGHLLKAHLQERFRREVLFLHGGTTRAARDAMVARFDRPEGPPLFILSLKAGGTGLNLVAANHVVHIDRWWNPAVEDQASDRAFRIGQTRNVIVRKLSCAGTLEERIAKMLADKRALASRVVGAGEGWLADLSVSAIRELVKLDAMEEP